MENGIYIQPRSRRAAKYLQKNFKTIDDLFGRIYYGRYGEAPNHESTFYAPANLLFIYGQGEDFSTQAIECAMRAISTVCKHPKEYNVFRYQGKIKKANL